ncbi:MAG: hypothetical protein ACHP8B_16380 [Terriglobales bacterium]
MNGGRRFIIVSNRLPVTVERTDTGFRAQKGCRGLVSALRPVLRDSRSCSIGWTGTEYAPEIPDLLSEHARKSGNKELADLFEKTANTERFEHFAEEAQLAGLFGSDADNWKDAIKGEFLRD